MYQKEFSWLRHWLQRMTVSRTSSGLYRAGLHGECSVLTPVESPLNGREQGGPLVPRADSQRQQVTAQPPPPPEFGNADTQGPPTDTVGGEPGPGHSTKLV